MGLLCSLCIDDFYKDAAGTCVACSSGDLSAVAGLVGLVVVIVVAVVLVLRCRRRVGPKVREAESVAELVQSVGPDQLEEMLQTRTESTEKDRMVALALERQDAAAAQEAAQEAAQDDDVADALAALADLEAMGDAQEEAKKEAFKAQLEEFKHMQKDLEKAKRALTEKVKLVVTNVQIATALVGAATKTEWPPNFSSKMTPFQELFEFNVLSLPGLGCTMSQSHLSGTGTLLIDLVLKTPLSVPT